MLMAWSRAVFAGYLGNSYETKPIPLPAVTAITPDCRGAVRLPRGPEHRNTEERNRTQTGQRSDPGVNAAQKHLHKSPKRYTQHGLRITLYVYTSVH